MGRESMSIESFCSVSTCSLAEFKMEMLHKVSIINPIRNKNRKGSIGKVPAYHTPSFGFKPQCGRTHQ